jgi:type I restriction-modification system DNA methylase subunit
VAARVEALFEEAKRESPDVFAPTERIGLGARALADVAAILAPHRLTPEPGDPLGADLVGHAYEEYTATHLKRKKGQFFTNRLVVGLLVGLVDPGPDDVLLDPAGGSGGFLSGARAHVRARLEAGGATAARTRRALAAHAERTFSVEIDRRLVKLAKASRLLAGQAHDGLTQGDGLGPFEALAAPIRERCGRGVPTVVLTNPPFAGAGAGRIADADVLARFACGRRWDDRSGVYAPTGELLAEGAPPELLFFERSVDWLAPGGRLGIVLPKSFLDTQTYRPARALLFERCRLLAVVTCHRHAFQPHTGVRTCLVVVEKLAEGRRAPAAYPIFLAVSQRAGQDSEGAPVFRRDARGEPTAALDHDLDEILAAWRAFRAGERWSSPQCFAIDRRDLDDALRINPQAFLPTLHETLRAVASMDGVDGFRVVPLGELGERTRVWKGPRLKSESLLADGPGPGVEPYYTPSALLQENADSIKWLDARRASAEQRRTLEAIRVRRGDLLVTRSGSIGRVVVVTSRHDGALVSDDLIRVRIEDEELRLWAMKLLQSRFGRDQMRRNEYGAIQQHLEPEHLRELLVPVPEPRSRLAGVVRAARRAVRLKEQLWAAGVEGDAALEAALAGTDRHTGCSPDEA